jgi:hypothetical protein
LKLLTVVVKNLADPQKSVDPKYRHLKTCNEKIATKLLRFVQAVEFLISIGFSQQKDVDSNDGSTIFQIPAEHTVDLDAMQAALLQVTAAMAKVATPSSTAAANTHVQLNQKPVVKERLSEKQKARLLLAKKEAEEKKLERAYREKNIQALKQDEHVRRNDPNWKSGVSSACSKSGSSISTFRDKYGEN